MNNNPIILFRKQLGEEGEFEVASKYFEVFSQRTQCHDNTVICRYSCLPFFEELEQDLANQNCTMINTYKQHKWIADFEYYEVLKEYTPETWNDDNFQYCDHPGNFVVKGKTNSRKFQWDKMMFARTKIEASEIAGKLSTDLMIGQQGIIYRKYVPLKTFEVGLNNLPFTNEWRFFYLLKQRLSYGYYWTIAEDAGKRSIPIEAIEFADFIADIVSQYVNFFVLDIAETEEGEWILIEINDGMQSGLSMNDPDVLYKKLQENFMKGRKS